MYSSECIKYSIIVKFKDTCEYHTKETSDKIAKIDHAVNTKDIMNICSSLNRDTEELVARYTAKELSIMYSKLFILFVDRK